MASPGHTSVSRQYMQMDNIWGQSSLQIMSQVSGIFAMLHFEFVDARQCILQCFKRPTGGLTAREAGILL